MIELGRYQTDHISRENRLCPLCKSNQVENETHFLLNCSKYSLQWRIFLNRINEIIPKGNQPQKASNFLWTLMIIM